ncbi:hypothetical protein [Sphingobium sp.]|uniref:hypothetical protein n=1 Tax=Sphingobium sp. TaxID=1912891 RepID=UPI002CD4F77D|nr:hypothetical protein [Sphingobium sp.]HUD92747.1 hypothetical protein [Sphingobium sp.]
MTVQFPPLPTAAIREDGWSPARQRRFLETLASSGVVMLACESVRITARSAYNLRIRRDGAAFRLGWDAAILIARARLADDLLARAITGCTDTIRRDEDNFEVTRHRHDNRLAMSMLARLDRMADCPAEGSDAALARIVAQDFVAYLDMICPEEATREEADRCNLPRPGAEPSARTMEDARMLDGEMPDTPEPVAPDAATNAAIESAAAILSPGASAALFVAARLALRTAEKPQISDTQERCELRTPPVVRGTLPPEEAAARLRGIWWDEDREGWRTDYPAPPGFDGEESDEIYDVDDYERDLTPQEEEALAIRDEAERRPYEDAAARARDVYFGFIVAGGADGAMAGAPLS